MSRRTTVSAWVYRSTIALLALTAIRGGRLMMQQMDLLTCQADGSLLWLTKFNSLTPSLGIGLCIVAILLRSGAAVWLLGSQYFFFTAPLLISLMHEPSIFWIGMIIAGAIGAILAGLLTYLVSKEELRKP